MKSSRRPRKSFSQRLAEIGMSQADFDYYEKTFVVRRGDYYLKTESGWIKGKKPEFLTKYYIIRHLQKEIIVGRTSPDLINYFCIDLDNKNHLLSLRERYDTINRIFGCPLVIRSSSSGGLHLYYFIKTKKGIDKKYLAALLRQIFNCAGVELTRGSYEIFPGIIHQLRLPLGVGSTLLDSNTLEPLDWDLHNQIEYISQYRKTNKIYVNKILYKLKPNTVNTKSALDNKEKLPTSGKLSYDTPDSYPLFIQRILETPLQYGTRHETMMKLVCHFMNRGDTDLYIENRILNYLQKPGHKSKDLEKNPELVKRDLKGLINNYRKKFNPNAYRPEIVYFNDNDISFILEVTNPLKMNDRYGNDAFYMQQFLFQLFGLYKRAGAKTLRLSTRMLEKFDYSSQKRLKPQLEFFESKGIITLVANHSRQTHLCRRYRLNYSFTEKDEEFWSFEKALCTMFSKSQLFSMYSRQMYRKILINEKVKIEDCVDL
jgi:hypothetical protein